MDMNDSKSARGRLKIAPSKDLKCPLAACFDDWFRQVTGVNCRGVNAAGNAEFMAGVHTAQEFGWQKGQKAAPDRGYGFGFEDLEGRSFAIVSDVKDHLDIADVRDRPRKIIHVNVNAARIEYVRAAIAVGSGGGLQAMGQAVDGKAAVVTVQQFQVRDHPIGQGLGELHELASDQLPVFLGAVLHTDKLGSVVHGRSCITEDQLTGQEAQELSSR